VLRWFLLLMQFRDSRNFEPFTTTPPNDYDYESSLATPSVGFDTSRTSCYVNERTKQILADRAGLFQPLSHHPITRNYSESLAGRISSHTGDPFRYLCYSMVLAESELEVKNRTINNFPRLWLSTWTSPSFLQQWI
jgi:hypothetical protein